MKQLASPKRFFILAFLSLNCGFLYSQNHISDWFCGFNTTIVDKWKINPEFQKNGIPQLRTAQYGGALGMNVYAKKFILTATYGYGLSESRNNEANVSLRQGLIEMDLKYILQDKPDHLISAGLSFQFRSTSLDIVKSNQSVDLGNPFSSQSSLRIANDHYAIGPALRVDFFRDKNYAPQLICSYTFGLSKSPWTSSEKPVLNSPTERQNAFNVRIMFPFLRR